MDFLFLADGFEDFLEGPGVGLLTSSFLFALWLSSRSVFFSCLIFSVCFSPSLFSGLVFLSSAAAFVSLELQSVFLIFSVLMFFFLFSEQVEGPVICL